MKDFLKLALFSIIASLATPPSAQASQRIGRYLTPISLPSKVKKAVDTNYNVGRNNWDMGGISKIRVFKIEDTAAQRTSRKLLTDVVELTASEDGSLAKYCKTEVLIDNAPECAAYLVGYAERHELEPTIGYLSNEEAEEGQEGRSMNDALATIVQYLHSAVGTNYMEYSVSTDLWSVDISVSVLIDQAKKTLIIVNYDLGA